ncbi:MAG: peptidylprolyl isomerase [Oscillospiraceae bacterium]|jgi:parvulin-like peptidyl-prolyl isomerase|nr:peptidylprolyl isomerase [Oscillospiraceae bacterium]
MSASREKRERQKLRQEELANPKKKRKKKQRAPGEISPVVGRVVVILIVAAIVLGLGYFVANGTGLTYRVLTAVTAGDVKLSPAEYNFYYYTIRNNYVNSYGAEYEEIFASSILEQTNTSIQTAVGMEREARENGMTTLTEESRKTLAESLESFETFARDNQTSLQRALEMQYGAGMDRATFVRLLERQLLVEQWLQQKQDSFTYTQDEIDAYYAENKDAIDVVDYRVFNVSIPQPETEEGETPSEEETAALDASAQTTADEFNGKITDESSFSELAREYAATLGLDETTYADDSATLRSNAYLGNDPATGSASLATEQSAWLADPARKAGDHAVVKTASSYDVLFFLKRYRDEYPVVDVRHILVLTSEEKDAAQARTEAEAILNEWKAGAATEDSFAALATEKTEDTGSASDGGLYEGVMKNQMVAAFDAWIFDPARKPGDTDLVDTDYGCHVMYFVGSGLPAWAQTAQNQMRERDFTDYNTQVTERYPLTENSFGMGYVKIIR